MTDPLPESPIPRKRDLSGIVDSDSASEDELFKDSPVRSKPKKSAALSKKKHASAEVKKYGKRSARNTFKIDSDSEDGDEGTTKSLY
jgi:hypothetical protein